MQIVPRLSSARIYRLPPWRRFTPLYPSLVVVGVLWIIILSTANTGVSAVLFVGLPLTGFFLLLGALICLTTINVHLELAPDGIMYEGTGYQVYSPWSNILEVDQVHYGFRQVDGVRLRLPAGEEVPVNSGQRFINRCGMLPTKSHESRGYCAMVKDFLCSQGRSIQAEPVSSSRARRWYFQHQQTSST